MPNASLLTALTQQLARGPAATAELIRVLGVSQPTLSRAIAALERDRRVVRIGSTRGARYGLARPVDAVGSTWPLYRVDASGRVSEIGPLHALERHFYYAPRGPSRIRGLAEGMPYYLEDARPAGFLGRAIPRAFPELAVPTPISDWTDEHFLAYAIQRGADMLGDLILGEASADRYLAGSHGADGVAADERAQRYPEYAAAAMAGAPAGSSAQGEQPKFLLQVKEGTRRTPVLVKFSPPRASAVGQRWADLLVCEHLAHELIARASIGSCRSRLFVFADRVFLEIERFDRIGAEGRRGTVSLYAVDLARYGKLDSWSECARRLETDEVLSSRTAERIRLLEAFATLIANTDRHFGNITLFDDYEGPFELAPVYDMLPMLFAPHHDQLIDRDFEPPRPTAASLMVWGRASALAQEYWAVLANDERLSEPFRALCTRCLTTLRKLTIRGT